MKQTEPSVKPIIDKYTLMALLVSLVAYPVLYSTDFFGNILFSVLPEIRSSLLDESGRTEWWYFLV